ncbi:MAG TPA: carbohydrate binding family 9 domain-containing protein, partial [Longimicrobiaceae bacterium]|nr:carbohydrate binding family 9 domain-containing protein [Longimicrobiaceae bacterium]
MKQCARAALAALGVSIATAAIAESQESEPYVASAAGTERSASAARVAAGPSVAGWRTNAVWSNAQVLSGFVQQEPVEGAPASERTEVRIVYDDEAIYVGAWLYDSDASRIITGERRRDASMNQSDSFLLIFDTFRDQQNGFVFGTHPGGIEYDGQVVNEGRGGGGASRQQGGAGGGVNVNWDGNWTVATDRDAEGWYAYFRIPFSTLRYGSDEVQTWGVNFNRSIARKNEQVFWSPISRQHNLYRVSSAGILQGIEVPQRRVMTVTPYALASAQRIPALHEGVRYPFDIGGDAKIGITHGLTLDLTLNTDF